MTDLNRSRNNAFEKLTHLTESIEFRHLRKEIVTKGIFQKTYLEADKFRRQIEEFDLSLIWLSEYTHFLKKGWLNPCYIRKKDGTIDFDPPAKENISESLLDASYFHPYRVLQAANCANKSRLIRSMLVMCWRGIENRRGHLKSTRDMDEKPYGSFNPSWIKAITEFGIVLEPIYRPRVRRLVTLHNRFDFDGYYKDVEILRETILAMTKAFEETDWKEIHDITNFISNGLDNNVELKTLITLMRNEDQERIKGKIGASLLIREVAHLIRYHALDQKITLPEEQFSESPGYTPAYFAHSRGSKNIVDGTRENRLKFIRGFGLDFSIRVRLYVEGETEKQCFIATLGDYGHVEIIDIKGEFLQKGGKGLAFRESLRNDKRSHIYSVLVLDGDREDVVRIVEDAAKKGEFLGQFFINEPDFELHNFSISELCAIVSRNYGESLDESLYAKAKSGKELFAIMNSANPSLNRVSKGADWGLALGKFAEENPKTNPPGMSDDRAINQVIRFCHFTALINFANDALDKMVDYKTGRLIDKKDEEQKAKEGAG